MAVAGVPRGTRDVDVNVFVGPEQLDSVVDALVRLGMTVDRAAAQIEAEDARVRRWDEIVARFAERA